MHENEPLAAAQPSHNPLRPLGRGMALAASLLVLGLFYLYFDGSLRRATTPIANCRSHRAANWC